jgi:hypothetical protein
VLAADDVHPVRELVEPERVEVQPAPVPGVERKDPRVPVARAHECDEPHQLDQQLVGRETGCPSCEIVDLPVEPPPRDVPVGARMLTLEPLRDRAEVV